MRDLLDDALGWFFFHDVPLSPLAIAGLLAIGAFLQRLGTSLSKNRYQAHRYEANEEETVEGEL